MRRFYTLVFSNNLRVRIFRHTIFWLMWISFYAFVQAYNRYEWRDVPLSIGFPQSWFEMLIQIPIDIAFCYTVIYFLLPRFFLKSRYLEFILLWILFVSVTALIQAVYYDSVVPAFRLAIGNQIKVSHSSLFLSALSIIGSLNTEGGFAAAVKLGKMLFIKQKEADLLSKEKRHMADTISADNVIQPTFLFNALNRLYSLAQQEQVDTSSSLRKINNLILYVSYDAKRSVVLLEKELEALKEYIELEKISYNYNIDVSYTVTGAIGDNSIAPYVLIPLVENSFTSLGKGDVARPWLNIEIILQNNVLQVKIRSSKSADTSTLLGEKNSNIINIQTRLRLLYPSGYHINKVIEPEMLSVNLRIDLGARIVT